MSTNQNFSMDEPPNKRMRLRKDNIEVNTEKKNDTPNFSMLNDDILAKIFGYLSLFDLLQMYEVNEAYQKIITEKVMPNRILDISKISKHYPVRDAFRKLGKFAINVHIKQSDIQYKSQRYSRTEEIIRLIGKRCSAEHLKRFTIHFDSSEESADAFRTDFPDCMRSVKSLTIIQTGTHDLDDFLKAIGSNELISLTLKTVKSPEKCLKALNLKSLRKLAIERSIFSGTEVEFLLEFFRKGIPSLKTLSLVHAFFSSTFQSRVFDLSQGFPALDTLVCDEHSAILFSQLPKLKHLKVFNLHIYGSSTFEILQMIAKTNSLQSLSIGGYFSAHFHNKYIQDVMTHWIKTMKMLTKLHSIKFTCNDLPWMDMVRIIQELRNVSKVHLVGKSPILQDSIQKLIEMSDVRTLIIEGPMSSFTTKLYDMMVKRRERWYQNAPPLDIYVDRNLTVNWLKKVKNYNTKSKYIRIHPLKKD